MAPQSDDSNGAVNVKQPFLTDLQTIRERARAHIEEGSVTGGYRADRDAIVKLLNDALATELVCVLRYKRHYFMAQGTRGETVASEFQAHATEEQQHADQLADRIVQLGGEPDFEPSGLVTRSASEYVEGSTLEEMVREDLIAERVAIDTYTEMIRYVGEDDSTTRRLLEEILAKEEEHADDMRDLLADMRRT
jgi:bacterioferritin